MQNNNFIKKEEITEVLIHYYTYNSLKNSPPIKSYKFERNSLIYHKKTHAFEAMLEPKLISFS